MVTPATLSTGASAATGVTTFFANSMPFRSTTRIRMSGTMNRSPPISVALRIRSARFMLRDYLPGKRTATAAAASGASAAVVRSRVVSISQAGPRTAKAGMTR